MRAGIAERLEMIMSYEPARTILAGSFGFVLFGTLPRALGIISTTSEWMPYMDALAVSIFVAALVWSAWAIVHNAAKSLKDEKR